MLDHYLKMRVLPLLNFLMIALSVSIPAMIALPTPKRILNLIKYMDLMLDKVCLEILCSI